MFHEHELLVAEHGVQRVDGEDLRNDVSHQLDLGLGQGDALGWRGEGFVGQRCREAGLPPGRRVEAWVNGQGALQQGGAGARQADDDQWVVDGYLGDFRMTAEVVLHHQAVDQLPDQPLLEQMPACLRQLGLAGHGIEQRLQSLAVVVIAKVAQAVGALAGACQQLVDSQILRAHTASATAAILTTFVVGWHCSRAPTQRRHRVPWRTPAVCSQLATPGSRSLSTRVTPPLASYRAWCLLQQMRW
ncbi:hypothetical protein D3C85_1100340 [compost metagenome]